MLEVDFAIIGAGPAGAFSAYLLSLQGHTCALFDRSEFPRSKVCGCCIAPAALQILEQFKILNRIIPIHAPQISKMHLISHNSSAIFPIPIGRAVSRTTFDYNLLSLAKEVGALIFPNTQFFKVLEQSDERICFQAKNLTNPHQDLNTFSAKIIIDASGLASAVMRTLAQTDSAVCENDLIGLGCQVDQSKLEPGLVRMQLIEGGYVGAVSLENGKLDLAAATSIKRSKQTRALMLRISEQFGGPSQKEIVGTPVLQRSGKLNIGRCVAIGDSARYYEPFTGQGISWALIGAFQFSQIVATNGIQDAAYLWPRHFQIKVVPQMRACKTFSFFRRANLIGPKAVNFIGRFPAIGKILTNYAWQEIELHT